MLAYMIKSTIPLWFKGITEELKQSSTYKSELERYIIVNNPQSTYDVERLTRDFDRKTTKRLWW